MGWGAIKASFLEDHVCLVWPVPGSPSSLGHHWAQCWRDGERWGVGWTLAPATHFQSISTVPCMQAASLPSVAMCMWCHHVLWQAPNLLIVSLACVNKSEAKQHRNNHGCAMLTSKLAEIILFSPRKACAVFVFCSWLLMAY